MAYVNSLEDIQSLIGNIDTWPSEIIYKMEEYNRRNVLEQFYLCMETVSPLA